jgi:hypothetical protein
MSYLQRYGNGESPFAQISNTIDWNINNRPDTVSAPWLSATTTSFNGYEFTGQGYIFGYLTATDNSLARVYIGTNNFYTSGAYHYDVNQNWANSDDEMIYYGNDTTHYKGTQIAYANYDPVTRFNIIRMEA